MKVVPWGLGIRAVGDNFGIVGGAYLGIVGGKCIGVGGAGGGARIILGGTVAHRVSAHTGKTSGESLVGDDDHIWRGGGEKATGREKAAGARRPHDEGHFFEECI